MKQKTIAIAIASLGIVGAIGITEGAIGITEEAKAQYVNYRENGSPSAFLFRSGTGLTPGQEVTYTLSQQMQNLAIGTPNACGYRILSPGANAESIGAFHGSSGPFVETASLPIFDGRCTATASGNSLVPATEGAAIPTSHYRTPDGKVAIKIDPGWTYFSVWYNNVTRKTKAGRCGEVRVTITNAKEGQRPIDFTGIVNIPGVATNIDLEDVNQDGKDAICSQRWTGTPGTPMTRTATWFFQP